MKSEHGAVEKGNVANHNWRSRSRSPSWRRQYHAIPRFLRLALVATVTFILFHCSLRLYQDERDRALKSQPTDFETLLHASTAALKPPPRPVRRSNGTHISDRYLYMRELGKGMQGSAALYTDLESDDIVVVKTYKGRGHNRVPESLAAELGRVPWRWPAEIEAGLLLGDSLVDGQSVYVPVRDYFLLDLEDEQDPWVMVTPFIAGGTLVNLANSLQSERRTPQQLDATFRPVLNTLVAGLAPLHEAGYCHNDIKPENIFVAASDHWLLGDLGGVREYSHPWHWTRRRERENQWTDCKVNDVRRALKTYLWFLRTACDDPAMFDRAFYAGVDGWSKLYWGFTRQPVGIDGILELSSELDPARETEAAMGTEMLVEESACLRRSIELELTCTTLHHRLQDYWPFGQC